MKNRVMKKLSNLVEEFGFLYLAAIIITIIFILTIFLFRYAFAQIAIYSAMFLTILASALFYTSHLEQNLKDFIKLLRQCPCTGKIILVCNKRVSLDSKRMLVDLRFSWLVNMSMLVFLFNEGDRQGSTLLCSTIVANFVNCMGFIYQHKMFSYMEDLYSSSLGIKCLESDAWLQKLTNTTNVLIILALALYAIYIVAITNFMVIADFGFEEILQLPFGQIFTISLLAGATTVAIMNMILKIFDIGEFLLNLRRYIYE